MLKFISNMSVELNITTKLMKCLLIRLVLLTNMLKIVFILHSCLLHPKSAKVQFVGSFTCTCYIFKRYLILTSILNKLQKDKLNDVMIKFKNIAITQRQNGPCIFLENFKCNGHIYYFIDVEVYAMFNNFCSIWLNICKTKKTIAVKFFIPIVPKNLVSFPFAVLQVSVNFKQIFNNYFPRFSLYSTWYSNPCPTKKMKSIINIPCQLVQNDLQI